MASIQIVGRLGRDPEALNNGCKFSVCEDGYDYKKKEKVPHWFSVVAFGKTGETCMSYLRKGQWVAITGRCEPYSFVDKEQNKRNSFNFTCESMKMIGNKSDADPIAEAKPMKAANVTKEDVTFDDEDIPF